MWAWSSKVRGNLLIWCRYKSSPTWSASMSTWSWSIRELVAGQTAEWCRGWGEMNLWWKVLGSVKRSLVVLGVHHVSSTLVGCWLGGGDSEGPQQLALRGPRGGFQAVPFPVCPMLQVDVGSPSLWRPRFCRVGVEGQGLSWNHRVPSLHPGQVWWASPGS